MNDEFAEFQPAPEETATNTPQAQDEYAGIGSAPADDEFAEFQQAPAENQIDYESANKAVMDVIERGGTVEDISNTAAQFRLKPNLDEMQKAVDYRAKNGAYEALGGRVNLQPNETAPTTVSPHQDNGSLYAGVLGGLDTATAGTLDEGAAGIGAIGNSIAGVFGGGTGEDFGDYYTRVRDENRGTLANAQADHGLAFGVGQVGGGLASLPFGGGAASIGRLATRGAIGGAAYGAGSADGDLASRAYGAATGGVVGAGSSAALGGLARVASPTVNATVRKLLDAKVRLTPGQIIGAGGGVGTVAREIEDGLKSLPFVGSMVERAQTRSLNDVNRYIGSQAVGESIPTGGGNLRPEQYFDKARRMAERQETQAQSVADLYRADHSRVNLGAYENVPGARMGEANPRDILESITNSNNRPNDVVFKERVAEAAGVYGESAVSKAGTYVDKLLGPWAKPITRAAVGAASVLTGGVSAVAGQAGLTGLYTQGGQRLAQSALTGRQGAVAKGVRTGIENMAPRVAPVALAPYGNRQPIVPNIEEQ